MSEETRSHLKPMGIEAGIIHMHKIFCMAVHLWERFYLFYKHLHIAVQGF